MILRLMVVIWTAGMLTLGYGATVLWQTSNVRVVQGLDYNAIEFENPLVGDEQVLGYYVIDWRDADYLPGPPNGMMIGKCIQRVRFWMGIPVRYGCEEVGNTFTRELPFQYQLSQYT
jgi:hypothetical protein